MSITLPLNLPNEAPPPPSSPARGGDPSTLPVFSPTLTTRRRAFVQGTWVDGATTSLTFISCHLVSDSGKKSRFHKRNKQANEMLRGLGLA